MRRLRAVVAVHQPQAHRGIQNVGRGQWLRTHAHQTTRIGKQTMTKQDRAEFRPYCYGITDRQLRNVYDRERLARRTAYANIAKQVMIERGLT
jgi:hypothetical protein